MPEGNVRLSDDNHRAVDRMFQELRHDVYAWRIYHLLKSRRISRQAIVNAAIREGLPTLVAKIQAQGLFVSEEGSDA